MKKNKMMRLASVLLVLTLLSTSVISGTFAKYVTSDETSDSARVAKWGVVASVKGDMFGSTYAGKDAGNGIITYETHGGTVSDDLLPAEREFLVAPGTQNIKAMTISVSGTPEVATKVIIDAPETAAGANYANSDIYLAAGEYGIMVKIPVADIILTKENKVNYYTLDGTQFTLIAEDANISSYSEVYELHDEVSVSSQYNPLQWYVDGQPNDTNGDRYTIDTVQDAIKTKFTYDAEALQPNKALDKNITIGWEWAFGAEWEDEDGNNKEKTTDVDRQDTILGNMMALYDVVTPDFYVVKDLVAVTYDEVEADMDTVTDDCANKVTVAKVGDDIVACLTASYNVRVTVAQVD